MQVIGTFFVAFTGYAVAALAVGIDPIAPGAIACGVGTAAGLLFSRIIGR